MTEEQHQIALLEQRIVKLEEALESLYEWLDQKARMDRDLFHAAYNSGGRR